MKLLFLLFLIQFTLPVFSQNFIPNSTLEYYFEEVLHPREDGLVEIKTERPSLVEFESEIDSLFPTGYYINLEDSLTKAVMERNTGPSHQYQEALEKHHKSHSFIYLGQVPTPLSTYHYLLILDKKGKIISRDKVGFGM